MSALNITDIHSMIETGLEDQTKDDFKGGFEFKRIPFGMKVARLVDYIEIGDHEQPMYDGDTKAKPDAPMAVLTFEFLSKDCITTAEDGTKSAMRRSVTIKKSFNEKSGYRKLFEKLRGGDNSVTHMLQLVGAKHWLFKVVWSTSDPEDSTKRIVVDKQNQVELEKRAKDNKDNKDFRIWDNFRKGADYWVHSPNIDQFDEEGELMDEKRHIPCPPAISGLRAFVWDNPLPQFWDSIFIDGEYEREVDGKKQTFSKNKFQDLCKSASNYEGSALQAMLEGTDDLPGMVDTKEPEDATDAPPAEPETPSEPEGEVSEEDPMDELFT